MYIVKYFEHDWDHNLIDKEVHEFETPKEAWDCFKESIAEHYHGKDFWTGFEWNDGFVESLHDAEDGWNVCLLYKWEGFDDDVKLSWKVDDVKYETLEELWAKRPEFDGEYICTDKPFILSKDNKQYAWLDIETFFDEKN